MGRSVAIEKFSTAIAEMYGDRLSKVVLYGSRARGDARPDSDYDVAVFLRGEVNRWKEVDRLIPIVTDILYSEHEFIHAVPYSDRDYFAQRPVMGEIRREGVEI